MAERLVAADASPLIGLASAGAFDLLRRLFGCVTVTTAVRDEVLAGGDLPGAREVAEAIEDGWIEVGTACPDLAKFPDLGAGEASTLTLASSRTDQCLVLMDDPFGRVHARVMDFPSPGLPECCSPPNARGSYTASGPSSSASRKATSDYRRKSFAPSLNRPEKQMLRNEP